MTQAHISNYQDLKKTKNILIGWKRSRSFNIGNNNSLFSLYYYIIDHCNYINWFYMHVGYTNCIWPVI
jgi:hypothetical protein